MSWCKSSLSWSQTVYFCYFVIYLCIGGGGLPIELIDTIRNKYTFSLLVKVRIIYDLVSQNDVSELSLKIEFISDQQ